MGIYANDGIIPTTANVYVNDIPMRKVYINDILVWTKATVPICTWESAWTGALRLTPVGNNIDPRYWDAVNIPEGFIEFNIDLIDGEGGNFTGNNRFTTLLNSIDTGLVQAYAQAFRAIYHKTNGFKKIDYLGELSATTSTDTLTGNLPSREFGEGGISFNITRPGSSHIQLSASTYKWEEGDNIYIEFIELIELHAGTLEVV